MQKRRQPYYLIYIAIIFHYLAIQLPVMLSGQFHTQSMNCIFLCPSYSTNGDAVTNTERPGCRSLVCYSVSLQHSRCWFTTSYQNSSAKYCASRSKCPNRITVHRTQKGNLIQFYYKNLQRSGHMGLSRQQQTTFVSPPHLCPFPLPDQVNHHPVIAPGNAQGAHLHSTAQTA